MLMGFVEQSTKLIDSDPKKYRFHWQHGEYKFNNIYLVHWFEQEFNCFVQFVDKKIDLVKQELSKILFIDEDVDYDLLHLQRLRDNNKKLALCFSGGYDSTYLFKKAVDNNIYFDKIVSCTVDSFDLPHSTEMKYNVMPWLEDYPDAFGEFFARAVPLEEFADSVKDPNYIFTDGCYNMPKFAVNQWLNFPVEEDFTYIRGETNGNIIYKNKKWYVTALNKNFSHCSFMPLSQFWVDPENMVSFIRNALRTRKHIIENYEISDSETFQMFRPSNEELFDVLGFTELYTPGIQGPKHAVTKIETPQGHIRGQKDLQFFELLIKYREDILFDILRGIKHFNTICNVSLDNQSNVIHNSGKFPWLIDLDTLELCHQCDVFK